MYKTDKQRRFIWAMIKRKQQKTKTIDPKVSIGAYASHKKVDAYVQVKLNKQIFARFGIDNNGTYKKIKLGRYQLKG